MNPNRLYYIAMYRKNIHTGEYIEAPNLSSALVNFNYLHDCEGYDSLIIRRIYRQLQMSHSIEQIARLNTKKINQLKTQKK